MQASRCWYLKELLFLKKLNKKKKKSQSCFFLHWRISIETARAARRSLNSSNNHQLSRPDCNMRPYVWFLKSIKTLKKKKKTSHQLPDRPNPPPSPAALRCSPNQTTSTSNWTCSRLINFLPCIFNPLKFARRVAAPTSHLLFSPLLPNLNKSLQASWWLFNVSAVVRL